MILAGDSCVVNIEINTHPHRGRGVNKDSVGGVKKNSARFARQFKNIYPPLQNPYVRPW